MSNIPCAPSPRRCHRPNADRHWPGLRSTSQRDRTFRYFSILPSLRGGPLHVRIARSPSTQRQIHGHGQRENPTRSRHPSPLTSGFRPVRLVYLCPLGIRLRNRGGRIFTRKGGASHTSGEVGFRRRKQGIGERVWPKIPRKCRLIGARPT